MKLSILALLTSVAYAGRPHLSIKISDGVFSGIDGLDPVITWEGESKSGDVDLTYGAEIVASPSQDASSLPKTFWGKASVSTGAWGFSARADMDAAELDRADLEVSLSNEEDDVSITLLGSVGSSNSVDSIEVDKGFTVGGGSVNLNPTFNLGSNNNDVILKFTHGDTGVELASKSGGQSLKLSQKLSDNDTVTPSFTSDGGFSLEWEHAWDDGALTANVQGSNTVDIEWEDGDWTANINVPLSSLDQSSVHVKRNIDF